MTSFHGTNTYGGITELELYEASNALDDEVSTSSLVAEDVYGETGNFSRGVAIGKGYGGTSTGANRLLVEGNVGIGTTSPVGKLHLYQSGSATNMIDKRTNISTNDYGQMLNYTHYSSVAQGANRDPDNSRGLWIGNMVDENDLAPSGANFVAFTNSFQFYVAGDQTKYDDGLSFTSNTDTLKHSGGNFIKAMHIDSDGNVGIGTTSPGYKLHVNGSSMFTSTINLTTSSGYAAIEMGGPSGAYIDLKKPASDDYDLRVITTGTGGAIQVGGVGDVMNFDGSGNVGIGTSSPIFPLDVTTYQHGNMTTPATWLNNTGSGIARTTITTSNFGDNISIRATHGIWTETFVGGIYGGITASDARIKKSISDVDDDTALQKLRQLKPKRYKYRDERIRGDRETIGFIAQEVEQIVPEAVTTKTGQTIPSILEIATVTASNILTFSDFSTASLESNTTTLQCYDVNNQPREITIASVLNDRSVQVKEDLSHWTASVDETGNVITETQTLTLSVEDYDALETDKGAWSAQTSESNVIECYTQTKTVYPGDKLYVQGEVVDDFHVLRKETIWALSTSALQEVDRQQQADKVRIAELETRVEELEAMVSIIKLNMTWPDA